MVGWAKVLQKARYVACHRKHESHHVMSVLWYLYRTLPHLTLPYLTLFRRLPQVLRHPHLTLLGSGYMYNVQYIYSKSKVGGGLVVVVVVVVGL